MNRLLLTLMLSELVRGDYLNPALVPKSPALSLQTINTFYIPSTGPLSMSVWIFGKATPTSDQDLVQWGPGKVLTWVCNLYTATNGIQLNSATPTTAVTPGVWTYLVVSCSASVTDVGVGSITNSYTVVTQGSTQLLLGGAPGRKFNGYLREFRVFDTGLSISQLHYYQYRKDNPDPILIYALDEGQGTVIFATGTTMGSTNIPPGLWEPAPTSLTLCPSMGFFFQGTSCSPCHTRCLMCTDSTYTSCQKCRNGCNLVVLGYDKNGSNTCNCPHRQNVASGGSSGLTFNVPSGQFFTGVSYAVEVWTKLIAWSSVPAKLVDTCSMYLIQSTGSQLALYEVTTSASLVLHGSVPLSGISVWVHLAVEVDMSGNSITVYRNAVQVLIDSLSSVVAPSCLILGGSAPSLQALFREVRVFNAARSIAQVQSQWQYRLRAAVPAGLLMYYPLDETGGSTLHSYGLSTSGDVTGTFSFLSDEDPMLTLCEVGTTYQTVSSYDNWWFCRGTSSALGLSTMALTLPLPDVSALPPSTGYYVIDFWFQMTATPGLNVTLVNLSPIKIMTEIANGRLFDIVFSSDAPVQIVGSPISLSQWHYLSLWVKSGEVHWALDTQTPMQVTGLATFLRPTQLTISAVPGFYVKYFRLFQSEIVDMPTASQSITYIHLGDLGLDSLIADWPLDEGIGYVAYDHSVNLQKVVLPTDATWSTIDSHLITPVLVRDNYCTSPTSCTVTPGSGILKTATIYLICNLAGASPVYNGNCSERSTWKAWRSRDSQTYQLNTPSPMISGPSGYEVSFWFSVSTCTSLTGLGNIITLGTAVTLTYDCLNSQFVVQAKFASGVMTEVGRRSIMFQNWYPMRLLYAPNPPTLRLWMIGMELNLQQIDAYYALASTDLIYFGKTATMSGFDGHLYMVLFRNQLDYYRRYYLWDFGLGKLSLFSSDSNFAALYSFVLDSAMPHIDELLNSQNIDLSSFGDYTTLFEIPTNDMSMKPDSCPTQTYVTSGCGTCDVSCNECQGTGAGGCYECNSGYFYHFSDNTCVNTCPAPLSGVGTQCMPPTCFSNCMSGTCTDVQHYSCGLQCAGSLDSNRLGYCNGLFVNPSATGSAISRPISASLTIGFTIQFWMWIITWDAESQTILQAGNYLVTQNGSSGKLQLVFNTADASIVLVSNEVVLVPGAWYFVSIAVSPHFVQFVTVPLSTGVVTIKTALQIPVDYTAPTSVIIGGTSPLLNGFLTELRVWQIVMDFTDIYMGGLYQTLIFSYPSTLNPNLALYYPLVEGTGNVLHSNIQSGFDQSSSITITGLVWQSPGTPLRLCPDTGYYYVFDQGFGSPQTILEATPWVFSVSASNTLTLVDGGTVISTISNPSNTWHHFAFSLNPSPLGMQVSFEGALISSTLPTYADHIGALYLGSSTATGNVDGYITDLYIINTALRASYINLFKGSILSSDPFIDMSVLVGYELNDGSGNTVSGSVDGYGKNMHVSISPSLWQSAPSLPIVCDPTVHYSTGTSCSNSPSGCVLGTPTGCYLCGVGMVVSSDFSACNTSCLSSEYEQYGSCFACSYPCTSCTMTSGIMKCLTCDTGVSPVSGVCSVQNLEALYFSALNEFTPITVANSLSFTTITVEFWVYFERILTTGPVPFAILGNLSVLVTNGNALLVQVSGTSVTTALPIPSAMTHFAIVYNPSNAPPTQLKLYLNGSLQSLSSYTGQPVTFTSFSIGANQMVTMAVREVRLWNVERAANDILYNYEYYMIPLDPYPIGLTNAVPFSNISNGGGTIDLITYQNLNYADYYGFAPGIHKKTFAISAVGSFLCNYSVSQGVNGSSCTPCSYTCDSTQHCIGPSATQCQACGHGFSLSGTTCTGDPILTKDALSSTCTDPNTVTMTTTGQWTIDFWVHINYRNVNGEYLVSVSDSGNSFQILFPSIVDSSAQVTSTIASVVTNTVATIPSGSWNYIVMQSMNQGGTAYRTRALVNQVAVHSTLTCINLTTLSIGGVPSFNGYLRTLRIWNTYLDIHMLQAYFSINSFALPSRLAEWDFTSFTAIAGGLTLSGSSICLTSIDQSQVPLACGSLGVFETVASGSGLGSCTSSCATACSVCTSSSASDCKLCDGTHYQGSGCISQTNLQLTSSSVLTWPLPSSVFVNGVVTIMIWVRLSSTGGSLLMKLVEGSNWLGISAQGYNFQVIDNTASLATCTGAALTWQHLALVLQDNSGTLSFKYYCNYVLSGSMTTTDPSTPFFSQLVLGDSGMTTTREVKELKIYSIEWNVLFITLYSIYYSLPDPYLVFYTSMEDNSSTILESVSQTTVSIVSTSFIQEPYVLLLCPIGSRLITSNPMCLPCEVTNCIMCSSSVTVCSACSVGYGSVNGLCAPCSSNCYTCSTSAVCTSCVVHASLTTSHTCTCNDNYYSQIVASVFSCQKCDPTCFTCTGPLSSNCLTCYTGNTVINNGRCLFAGLFVTNAEYISYVNVCTSNGIVVTPLSSSCANFLYSYCCPSTSPLSAMCISIFGQLRCRPCNFDNSALCNNVESLCWNTDFSVKPINNACLSGIYSYCCGTHTPSTDCSAFPYSFNQCTTLGPPAILRTVWNDGMTSFNVTFNMAIDASQFAGTFCSSYFDTGVVSTLGSGSTCQLYQNSTILYVSLGLQPTISYGPLNFLRNVVKSAMKYGAFGTYLNVTVLVPSTVNLMPQANLQAPGESSICSDLVLSGVSSTGGFGRGLFYIWAITGNVSNPGLDAFMQNYTSYSSLHSLLTIPKSVLVPYSSLSVSFSVRNLFGLVNTTTARTNIVSGNVLQVAFSGSSAYTIQLNKYYEFPVTITPSNCGGSPSRFDTTWSLVTKNCTATFDMTAFTSTLKNPLILAINPYVLTSGCAYTFEVTVTPEYPSGPGTVGAANLSLTVAVSDLTVIVIGGDIMLSVDQNYTFDASRSSDQNNATAVLTFNWSRCTSGTTTCATLAPGPIYTLPALSLTAGLNYTFSVTVSNGVISKSVSKYINTTQTAVPAISIVPVAGWLNPCLVNVLTASIQSSALVTMTWSVATGGSVQFSSPVNQPTVSIAAFSLTPGSWYKFQLSVSTPITTSAAQISAYVNSPPSQGSFSVSPSTGLDMTTRFQLTTSDWQDSEGNLPITYQFFRIDNGTMASITSAGMTVSFSSILAIGDPANQYKTRIGVQAFDSLAAWSQLYQDIVVSPAFADQHEKVTYASNLTTTLLSQGSALSSGQNIPVLLNTISQSVFSNYTQDNVSADSNYTTAQGIFTNVIGIIQNWWNTQPQLNLSVGVVADCLGIATQAPAVLNTTQINQTLALVQSITSYPLDQNTAQSLFNVLSNLDTGNSNTEMKQGRELNSTQTSIRTQLETVGRSLLQGAVRDQDPSVMTSTSFNGFFQRLSPGAIPNKEIRVQSTQNQSNYAKVAIPGDVLSNLGVRPDSGIDLILIVSKNKPNRGGYANATQEQNQTSSYVSSAESVKVQFEVSGTVSDYGEFVASQRTVLNVTNLSTPFNITIPFKSASANATTTCVFYNEAIGNWTTSGCTLLFLNFSSNTALCSCNHLTEFSIDDAADGAIAAAESANIGEATNFGAFADINFTGNAIGLYVAVALLGLYAMLGLLCKWKDAKDLRELEEFYNDPEKNLADAISRNKDLYNIFVSGEGVIEPPPQVISSSEIQSNVPEPRADEQTSMNPESPLPQSTLIYLKHFGLDVNSPVELSKPTYDFSHVRPAPAHEYVFYEDRVVRSRRSCWELLVSHHSIFSLFFRVSSTFPRFARLTIVFCALFGKLFVTGFFYNNNASKATEKHKDFSEVLQSYTWYDFFLALMSAFIVIPVVFLVSIVLNTTRLTDDMSEHKKMKVTRRNKIRRIVGYALAWVWMVACAIEITLFAIQFNVSVI